MEEPGSVLGRIRAIDPRRGTPGPRTLPPLFDSTEVASRNRACYESAVGTFDRRHEPDRPGQVLVHDGEPVALVTWAHDWEERDQTGWFLILLGGDGEPDGAPPTRLDVSPDVDRLVADAELSRAVWIAQAETLELVTAPAALDAGERALARLLP
jgi:hypothetical protein